MSAYWGVCLGGSAWGFCLEGASDQGGVFLGGFLPRGRLPVRVSVRGLYSFPVNRMTDRQV